MCIRDRVKTLLSVNAIPFSLEKEQDWYSYFNSSARQQFVCHKDTIQYLSNPIKGILVLLEDATGKDSGESYRRITLCEPKQQDNVVDTVTF